MLWFTPISCQLSFIKFLWFKYEIIFLCVYYILQQLRHTGHNSLTRLSIVHIYVYCRHCRLYIINVAIKKYNLDGNYLDVLKKFRFYLRPWNENKPVITFLRLWLFGTWHVTYSVYQITWHHTPEGCNLNIHRHENFRALIFLLCYLLLKMGRSGHRAYACTSFI
jgi:hypothetical protein